ncbi:hypothetical protein [Sphingomonas aerolata]|uniref:hypothetical protein n=1 Tax=Sphingomonas aerolata TaxID=185951 RepID=UPI003346D8A4
MVGIAASADSKRITIYGHGLSVAQAFTLAPGIRLEPDTPAFSLDSTVDGCASFSDYAAVVQGRDLATFSLVIETRGDAEQLTGDAWNALWLFHLLSIACRSPALLLFAVSDGIQPRYSAANRTVFVRPVEKGHSATTDELVWARDHADAFSRLISIPEFNTAMRCFGNAHYLPDFDVRIMLLWSGIEGLLSVDAELSRRLALYAALIIDGSPEEKVRYFDKVKNAYGIRSRAVHGSKTKAEKLVEGYHMASRILTDLLARCVELGRVPTPTELDHLAVSGIPA